MKKLLKTTQKSSYALISVGVVLMLFNACGIKLVADYDAATYDAILSTAKQVDTFYVNLLITPENERQFKNFVDQYVTIEVEMRSLVMRSKIRPLNDESSGIAETILAKWLKYKNAHETADAYTSAEVQLHWQRFTRLFTAMAIAEKAKPSTADSTQ